jgi:hypothetical protein
MKICTQCGCANENKTSHCAGCGVQLSTIPNASFYDKAARYSLVVPFVTIIVAILIFWLLQLRSAQLSPPMFRFSRWLSSVRDFATIAVIYCALFAQIASLALGIVSLFGSRKCRRSFWIALLGILVSAFFGLVIYAFMHMGWSGC